MPFKNNQIKIQLILLNMVISILNSDTLFGERKHPICLLGWVVYFIYKLRKEVVFPPPSTFNLLLVAQPSEEDSHLFCGNTKSVPF